MHPTFTAELAAQDAEYAEAVRADEDRNEQERQREEAVQTLVGPIQVDIVREARLRRLEATTSDRGTSPDGGENS